MQILTGTISLDNIPRTVVVDIYQGNRAVLYFPLTSAERKNVPYFIRQQDIRPYNREELDKGSSLMPSGVQAGIFFEAAIKNLIINPAQQLASITLELDDNLDGAKCLKLTGEIRDIDNIGQSQQELIKNLTQNELTDAMWHG